MKVPLWNVIFMTFVGSFLCTANSDTDVPVAVSPSSFPVGMQWVWQYEDSQSVVSSWERYEVTKREADNIVVLEMASRFPDKPKADFTVHHRMTVDVQKCLDAYRDLRRPKGWALKKFEYLSDGKWMPGGSGKNRQAFEEKFNCIASVDEKEQRYVYESKEISLPVTGKTRVFRQGRKFTPRGQYDSWYFQGPDALGGIAAWKDFNPDKPKFAYTFRLIYFGKKELSEGFLKALRLPTRTLPPRLQQ
uniref:Sulfatase-modifying factor enzyme domain-containing protein n=1 Tax=Chromera velia CCMP2878 TaxID=1169474 RepID=A0A0G4FWZ2_9ALVE|eukprot:Cvel_3855.t1-p1 / transcript=Cvel_3855.t1 / gene=Cvel_3855 / organism=Chromera_velia_CCMP2878 / gene_product=hypothetical protein / transcript_product=hypothetical protein / location=Cvel_scaffold163:43681-45575(+) / protein_length=246 / sequence_SO=supercontig / SO=protein_coding / is_pseudo=false